MSSEIAGIGSALIPLFDPSKHWVWFLSVVLFCIGASLAWRKKDLELREEKERNQIIPEILADVAVSGIQTEALALRIVSGGTAHRVEISIPSIGGFRIIFGIIPNLIPGPSIHVYPEEMVYEEMPLRREDGKTLGGVLMAMDNILRKELHLPKEAKCKIPLKISFQDKNLLGFEQNFYIENGTFSKPAKIFKEGAIKQKPV